MAQDTTDLIRLLRFEILDRRNGGRAACDLLMGQAADALERAEREIAGVRADAAATVAYWGAYADSYFQEKHDLAGDVARFKNVPGGTSAPGTSQPSRGGETTEVTHDVPVPISTPSREAPNEG